MSELVQKLAKGDHPVAVTATDLADFKGCVDRDYVHLKFTETRGGTELGFRLDPEHSDLSGGDFGRGSGQVRLSGILTVEGISVRCTAEVDLESLSGRGRLEVLES